MIQVSKASGWFRVVLANFTSATLGGQQRQTSRLSREVVFCKISRVLGSLCGSYRSKPHVLYGPEANDIASKGQLLAVHSLYWRSL